ncbi:MAG: hypothetical protein AAFN74_04690 [Myxococcota bacterium]
MSTIVAQDGNKQVSVRRPAAIPKSESLVDIMPANLAAMVVTPRLSALLSDLHHLNRLLSPLHPEWGEDGLHGAILDHWLSRSRLLPGFDGQNSRHLRSLLTVEGLVAAGVDPQGTLVLAPDIEDRVMLMAFELIDRPQFERWLVFVGGEDRQRLKLGAESATVIGPQTDLPITCLARRAYAMCQLGVPPEGDAVRPLQKLVALRGKRWNNPHGQRSILQQALGAMPGGAHIYVATDTKKIAPILERVAREWEQRAHRFQQPAQRRKAFAHAATLQKKIRSAVKLTDSLAAGLYTQRGDMEMRWQAHLTNFGRGLLSWWLPSKRGNDVIARWTRTPGLMRVVARTQPEVLEGAALSIGWSPPKGALTGDFGFLAMNLNPLSTLSRRDFKTNGADDGAHWGFIFPSAIALGVRSSHAADRIQSDVAQRLEPSRSRNNVYAPAATGRRRLHGQVKDNPFEVQVFDRLMVMGMGPGIGSAAVRRLSSMPPTRLEHSGRPAPFLDATLYPRAIEAAFAAANIGPEHRASLQALDAWRIRWRPLLTRLREVRLRGRLDPQRSRLVITGAVIE